MKKAIPILFIFLMCTGAFAQIPKWAVNLPKSNNPTMDYLVGIGEGNTYKNAYNEAICDALRKLILRFGLSVNSNDVMSAVYSGQELNTISRDYNIPPINNVCVSQIRQQGVERVYVLFQIPSNGMITNPVFEPFTKCANKKDDLKYDKGKYVAWNIAGTGYPWKLVDGIEFRYGGIIGGGAWLDLGMDFSPTYDSRFHRYLWGDGTKVSFHYSGGLKFYFYKGLFVDAGYSALANDTSGGLLFHAGYNLVTNLDKYGFFLGLSAGAAYEMTNKAVAPSINLKIGVAWNIDKQ